MISRIFIQRIDWKGITVEISYEPNWMGGLTEAYGEPLAHLQSRACRPKGRRCRSPKPDTGQRSSPGR